MEIRSTGKGQAPVKAFIFDCDGTLIDSMGLWATFQPRVLATYGVHATPEEFDALEHLSMQEECQACHDIWGVGESGEDVFDRFMSLLEVEYRENLVVRDGVIDFLNEARAAGIPMVVATSTPLNLVTLALDHNKLSEYFLDIITTEEAGGSKEHPDVYNLALSRLCDKAGIDGVSHDETWVFEDALFGLMSSGTAEYRRVGVFDPNGRHNRERVRENCEIFVDSVTELTLADVLDYQGA